MRTPDGRECKHYYQDFHRGRSVQRCRLQQENPESERWQEGDCARCRVPDILLANADPDLLLKLTIRRRWLGLRREVQIEAFSRRDGTPIADPYVGRTDTDHPGLAIFRQALQDQDEP
jgi:hypothetical protein